METDLFDYEALKLSKDFHIKHFKDSIYRGELDDSNDGNHRGKYRHGLGVCEYQNGRLYEGGWSKDKRHGNGFERFSNGNSYLGEYNKGQVDGKGLYKWKNGD